MIFFYKVRVTSRNAGKVVTALEMNSTIYHRLLCEAWTAAATRTLPRDPALLSSLLVAPRPTNGFVPAPCRAATSHPALSSHIDAAMHRRNLPTIRELRGHLLSLVSGRYEAAPDTDNMSMDNNNNDTEPMDISPPGEVETLNNSFGVNT